MDPDAELIAYLAEHDAECAGRGYQLRSLKTAVCPECGAHNSLESVKPSVAKASHIDDVFLGVATLVYATSASVIVGFGLDWLCTRMRWSVSDAVIGTIALMTFAGVYVYTLSRSWNPKR